MNDEKKILVLQSVVVGYASSLQPASLVVPPCQDIAYHIPNQEDNKVVKKEREREKLRHHHHATAHPSLNYPSLFQKKK